MRNIQVFLTGDNMAEINGDLIKIEKHDNYFYIHWKEESFEQRHYLPYSQIRMIRISEKGIGKDAEQVFGA